MAASNVLQKRINETRNQFSVYRQGELVSDPLTIEVYNSAGTTVFDVVVNGKLCISDNKTKALQEADAIELMTKEERETYLASKSNYSYGSMY
jgi:hypothetical protein